MKIRAICFDLFTLFDPRSVVDVAQSILPDAESFCELWRSRQFQYAFLRAAARKYAAFHTVTEDALLFAAKARQVHLTPADRNRLVHAYSELKPWPDTKETLQIFRQAGLKLAPLANYSPIMIERLLEHANMRTSFDTLISTDAAQTYKPDPRAYGLGPQVFGFPKESIAFSAFGGWDAAGAKWYGFPTFWVNRLGVSQEELAPVADGTGSSLAGLAVFVQSW
jgi:2-haloacid dehalogenase